MVLKRVRKAWLRRHLSKDVRICGGKLTNVKIDQENKDRVTETG